jgi:hypothetical protein
MEVPEWAHAFARRGRIVKMDNRDSDFILDLPVLQQPARAMSVRPVRLTITTAFRSCE